MVGLIRLLNVLITPSGPTQHTLLTVVLRELLAVDVSLYLTSLRYSSLSDGPLQGRTAARPRGGSPRLVNPQITSNER